MKNVVIAVATAVVVTSLALISIAAQTPATTAPAYKGPRTTDGKPNLNGIWQVLGTAHWDLEPLSLIHI